VKQLCAHVALSSTFQLTLFHAPLQLALTCFLCERWWCNCWLLLLLYWAFSLRHRLRI